MFAIEKLSPWENNEISELDKQFIQTQSNFHEEKSAHPLDKPLPLKKDFQSLKQPTSKSLSGANLKINRQRLQNLQKTQKQYKIVSSRQLTINDFANNRNIITIDQNKSPTFFLNFIRQKKSGKEENVNFRRKPSAPFIFARMKNFIQSKNNEKSVSLEKKMSEKIKKIESQFQTIDEKGFRWNGKAKCKKPSIREINFRSNNQQYEEISGSKNQHSRISKRNCESNCKLSRQIINLSNLSLQKNRESVSERSEERKKEKRKTSNRIQPMHFIDRYLDRYNYT